MMKGARGSIHKLVIARVAFATRGNLVILGLSLRGFEKAVAISVWQPPHPTHTVIARTEGSWQSQYGDNSRGVWYLTRHQMLSKIEFTN